MTREQSQGANETGARLGASDTRRLLDDYLRYRFWSVLTPGDFAKKAGVAETTIEDLFAQKSIDASDLDRIAQAIDVSAPLLSDIAGYHAMPPRMLQTLERFFKAEAEYRSGQKKAA